MAFLDFIKNRGEQQPAVEQQSQQDRKTEISQDLSTRQSSRNLAAKEAVTRLPRDIRSEAQQLGGRINRIAENSRDDAPALPQAPADATGNQQPMRQAMMGQDKPAPDNSPTSAQKGVRAEEVESPSAPSPTPAQSPQRTLPRPTPSWER
jgi:hypothetical protein